MDLEPFMVPGVRCRRGRFGRVHREPITLIAVPLGEPELGEWCHACLLPSGWRGGYVLELDGDPVTTITVAGCLECGRMHE